MKNTAALDSGGMLYMYKQYMIIVRVIDCPCNVVDEFILCLYNKLLNLVLLIQFVKVLLFFFF